MSNFTSSRRALLKTLIYSAFMVGCRASGVSVSPPSSMPTSVTAQSSPDPSTEQATFSSPTVTACYPVVSSSRIIAVSAGGANSLALTQDGTVWGWGRGKSMGLADEILMTPIELTGITDMAFIDTDEWNTSLFVDNQGQLLRAGYPDNMSTLNRLEGIDQVVKAKCNRDTILALRTDGTVWAYSDKNAGDHGLLGLSALPETGEFIQLAVNSIVDIVVSSHTALMVRADGTVWMWGNALGDRYRESIQIIDPPQPHPDISNAVAVTYGLGLTTIHSDGVVIQDLPYAVTPFKEMLTNAVQIDGSRGGGFSLALDADGVLWMWGNNDSSILGVNPDEVDITNTPVRIDIPRKVVTASAGSGHVLALDDEGTVWAWGSSNSGKLGVGPTETKYVMEPIPIMRSSC